MRTKRLFKEDVYLKETEATVTSVSVLNGNTVLTLDRTLFFPTGGGQSCDKGTIEKFTVLDVYEYEDEIYHRVNAPESAFSAGSRVKLELDWEHRFDNMQRHCGEHILSGIFHREFGGVNRGFHMGDSYMTIDISLEDNPRFDKITWDMAMTAELETNKAIWQNLPVITRHYGSRKEAEALPLRKALAIEKDITIVCVGSAENPSDCVACCGTHPSSAGQVGMVKIYKVESNKGMFRIYFEAGQRALEKYREQFDVLTQIENSLSAGSSDLMDKYKSQQDKNSEIRTELYLLKKEIIKRESEALRRALISDEQSSNFTGRSIISKSYELLSPDDISAIAHEISGGITKIVFLVHKPSKTVFLCSSENSVIDCGRLVKENASIYGGKGGGKKTFARAIFSNDENITSFIDLIEKHIK